MKKLLVIPFLAAIFFASCKKNTDTVSTEVTYSVPTITVNGQQYFSINVGGSLPTVSATAYDSFYKETYPVVMDASTLDNTTPGLYIVSLKASNKYGMVGTSGVYVAVTNIDPAIDLSGNYQRVSNGAPATLTELANGLYRTSNISGALSGANEGYFVQIDDTTIQVPVQVAPSFGTLYGSQASVHMAVGDTSYQYVLGPSSTFAQSVRVFQKL
jgi:hypothetical protein